MKIASVVVGVWMVNCWFLVNEDTKEALVFDPGDEAERILDYVNQKGWKVSAILLTHGHSDHIAAVNELRQKTKASVYAYEAEKEMLLDMRLNMSDTMTSGGVTVEPDKLLHDGQDLTLSGIQLKVIHTPGHTPGGCCFYCEEAGCLFAGDTLFQGSVGRSDFPGGSMGALIRSIKEKLFVLPDTTTVYPGHGGETTIAYEKAHNPFV